MVGALIYQFIGVVVSALKPGSEGGARILVAGNMFCSCSRHFILTLPLANEEFKWVPVIVSDA